MIYTFECVDINNESNKYDIKQGTLGSFSIDQIKKINIAYGQANFKGKTKPFLHQYIGGASFFTAMEPKIYVGLKIITKQDETLAIYISNTPVLYHSDSFFKDEKLAKNILKAFQTVLKMSN